MLHLVSELNKYLLTKVAVYAKPIMIDFFSGANEEIMARHDPSTAVEKRFFDGSRDGSLNVSYYTKSKDALKARDQLTAIIQALDIPDEVAVTDALTIKVEPVTTPQPVGKTDTGAFTYTASVKLDYSIGGK